VVILPEPVDKFQRGPVLIQILDHAVLCRPLLLCKSSYAILHTIFKTSFVGVVFALVLAIRILELSVAKAALVARA
jgi:hypothetical protein